VTFPSRDATFCSSTVSPFNPSGKYKKCCPLLNGSLVLEDVPLGAGEHLQDLVLNLLQLLLVVRPLHDQVVLFLLKKIQALPVKIS
jgi:hypothetical protein